MTRTTCSRVALMGVAAAVAAPAMAQDVQVLIENVQPSGGMAFTPFWLGFHDGSFDVFESGTMARDLAGITEIAELGDTSVLSGRFASEQPGGFDTTFLDPSGPPVFSPGESASMTYDLGDTSVNRFFNYASMVVPTNDLFVGNDSAIELFDSSGSFLGPVTIEIFGSSVYDNGTEVNDITDGPAFVAGIDAMGGTDEFENVQFFFSRPGATDYLDSIVGVTTAPGDVITDVFTEGELIGRITIVPAPATAAVFGLLSLGAMARRRR
ncbi:MAG: spondin domain-containing protein [Planctomycetota bacterium]